jgi:hypothetical protein
VGEPARDIRYAKTLIRLPDSQGAIGLRTGVVAFAKSRSSAKPEEAAAQGVIRPDQVVKISSQQRDMVTKWFFAKNLSQLPPGESDAPPEDPQLTKAVAVLQEALAKGAPTQTAEPSKENGA